ncbi:hypothetical protein MKY95_18680 [Paenibacillus sp. FSL P4-0176]|uniref:hypothetical protein n=1 Tax=Paenibacillus sp. FSL P4-0176 TaxID=2921631 RepID=UPI0030CCCB7B
MNDKWIVITYYDDFNDSEYRIKEFCSEAEAISYSTSVDEEDFYCVAKVIRR